MNYLHFPWTTDTSKKGKRKTTPQRGGKYGKVRRTTKAPVRSKYLWERITLHKGVKTMMPSIQWYKKAN